MLGASARSDYGHYYQCYALNSLNTLSTAYCQTFWRGPVLSPNLTTYLNGPHPSRSVTEMSYSDLLPIGILKLAHHYRTQL